MIPFEKVWGVNIPEWLPGVIAFWIPFPFHKVLEHSRFPMSSVVDQMLHFVFLSPLDEIGWGPREVRSMNGVFLIWGQK